MQQQNGGGAQTVQQPVQQPAPMQGQSQQPTYNQNMMGIGML